MSLTIQANTQNRINNEAAQLGNSADKTAKARNKKQDKNTGKTIFAGDLNLAENPIAKKRREAQEKALKIVRSAWESDQSVEKSIQDRKDSYDKMKQLKEEAQATIKDIEANKAALKEEYGIEDDSQEQEDLELLEKYQNMLAGVSTESFTEEEEKRLGEISSKPLTEYQRAALDLNEQKIKFKKDIKKAEQQMQAVNSEIRSIEQEKLKSDPMAEAQKAADSVRKAASDEIIGMLVDEAKEHIDEELEEEKEKAKEAAEEKEEKEEQLDEIREKQAVQEAIITGTKEAAEKAEAEKRRNDMPDVELTDTIELAQSNGQTGDVQKLLNEIKTSMNLLEADLKGIQVDTEV